MKIDWAGLIKRIFANTTGVIGFSFLLFALFFSSLFKISSSMLNDALANDPFVISLIIGLGIVFIILVILALAAFAAPEPLITNIFGLISAGFAFLIGLGLIFLAFIFSYIFASAFFIISAITYSIAFVGAKRLYPAISFPMGALGIAAGFWLNSPIQFEHSISSILSLAFILLGICALSISGYGFFFSKESTKCTKCGVKSTSKYCPDCGEKLK